MAFRYELGYGTLVKGTGDQQNDVVDHVAVRDVIEERAERLHGMIAHMLELDDQLLAQLVVDDGHGQRAGFVGQELPVIGGLQVQLEIVQGLALLKVQVIGVSEYAAFEPAAQALQVAAVDVEKTTGVHHTVADLSAKRQRKTPTSYYITNEYRSRPKITVGIVRRDDPEKDELKT